jgi:predicted Zn finger-like uncharacterized protein
MDVRCEKCGTEYELDEAKVTEAGVTVKCTSCGHLFKVRRRAGSQAAFVGPATNVGPAPSLPSTTTNRGFAAVASAPPTRAPRPLTVPPPMPDGSPHPGGWLVRNPSGQVQRFRELTTLQQWIVERKVGRDCEISRTGESWRKLGDIAELTAFFEVVDRADANARAAAQPQSIHKPTQPYEPSGVTPAPARATTSGPMMSTGRAPTNLPSEPIGPTGGLRGAPVLEPGWAGSTDAVRRTRAQLAEDAAAEEAPTTAMRPAGQAQPPAAFEPYDADDDLPPRSSKLPWLLAAAFVIMVGGAVGIYFMLMGRQKPAEAAAPADAAVLFDAAVATSTPIVVDAAVAAPTLEQAWKLFYDDGDANFEAAEKAFTAARGADAAKDAEALAGLALTNSAWAQALADDADASATADPRRAEQLRAEARRRLERADKFVKDALARDAQAPLAQVAAADVRRLQKAKTSEIDKLLAGAPGQPETNYVKGMARWSAGQLSEARKLLDVAAADFKAKQGREHVRARFRLALIAYNDKKYDEAKKQLGLLYSASPEHVRAHTLEARIGADTNPVPAAVTPDAGTGSKPPTPTQEPAPSGDAYDGLVAKGNAKAENGDCAAAMPLYERALDVRPGGVEALTGLGYCHLDRKEFARAQASFRAALGISPRFGDAIIGLAEAYRFQGQNDQALEQYKRYLDTNPNGPKAEMARRQVKNLAPAEPPPQPTPAPPPAPEPTPTPPPAEQQAPAPSGQP